MKNYIHIKWIILSCLVVIVAFLACTPNRSNEQAQQQQGLPQGSTPNDSVQRAPKDPAKPQGPKTLSDSGSQPPPPLSGPLSQPISTPASTPQTEPPASTNVPATTITTTTTPQRQPPARPTTSVLTPTRPSTTTTPLANPARIPQTEPPASTNVPTTTVTGNTLPTPIPPAIQNAPSKDYKGICALIVDDKSRSYPAFERTQMKDRILAAHNQDRNRFGLSPLAWNEDLASYAQKWAEHLRDNYGCEMRHRSNVNMREGKMFGENLAFFWTSQTLSNDSFTSQPEIVVANWDGECADYDLENNNCAAGKQCGHFTQVTWHNTERVGCGVAICNTGDANYTRGGRAEIWVCNYDPPGNFIDNSTRKVGRPFSMTSVTAPQTNQTASTTVPSPPLTGTPALANSPHNASGSSRTPIELNASSNIVLYGNAGCGRCVRAKQILDQKNILYEFKDIRINPSLMTELPKEVFSGKGGFPYVVIDGKFHGGLNELEEIINASTNPPKRSVVP